MKSKSPVLEREMGIEPTTSTLARWRTTTVLFPQKFASVFYRAENGIRTRDIHLGKVARYHCAISAKILFITRQLCERRDLNPYAEALDPKSSVYANFTTLA